MCRSSPHDIKRSSSSSPPPTHLQHLQPPSYAVPQPYSVEGAVAYLEAQPTTSMTPILVQRLGALANRLVGIAGGGASAPDGGAFSPGGSASNSGAGAASLGGGAFSPGAAVDATTPKGPSSS
ncbi:unnamed protein product [Rotaria sordida]|uniref:Uncharacterized protein n=1 Tax=Rotaria sordida TaxID=392033 RepID=A0A814MFP6_9BILA|nr:unnamed protein product [Rotaria sordida]CAF3957892.1 unnamed protein product [Rotaria sordida]